jgi:hypothetical protein
MTKTKEVELLPKRDAYGEAYMSVMYHGKDIGTIWLDPEKGTVDYESSITGMSWDAGCAAEAVCHLIDVFEEEDYREEGRRALSVPVIQDEI